MTPNLKSVRNLYGSIGVEEGEPLGLNEYQDLAQQTNKFLGDRSETLQFLLLGLFGEIGSLLSELKKKQRDTNSYFAYRDTSLEELGDALWYLSGVAKCCGLTLADIVREPPAFYPFVNPREPALIRTFRELQPQGRLFTGPIAGPQVQAKLLALAGNTASLAQDSSLDTQSAWNSLHRIFNTIAESADDAEANLEEAALVNLTKNAERWPKHRDWGELYDGCYGVSERFPRTFEVRFLERESRGEAYVAMSMNGINIGDRLNDNRKVQDDYRFHDVFHIAFAAILGWSPVLRALLRLKRKSNEAIDEQEDGARAVIAEEGITNWVFAQGERHQYFKGANSLDFSLLKTLKDMVRGYEVASRPFWMWEVAILEAFRVFRLLKDQRGGYVLASLDARSIDFRAIDSE